MKKITNLFTILCFTFLNQTHAQFASYSFDTDASDAINGYHPNSYGDVDYIMDSNHSVIELEDQEFLNFPI